MLFVFNPGHYSDSLQIVLLLYAHYSDSLKIILEPSALQFDSNVNSLCDSECVDLERREKERIHFDLDKAEKLKSQLASEVDDHHAAIERNNELNLR